MINENVNFKTKRRMMNTTYNLQFSFRSLLLPLIHLLRNDPEFRDFQIQLELYCNSNIHISEKNVTKNSGFSDLLLIFLHFIE